MPVLVRSAFLVGVLLERMGVGSGVLLSAHYWVLKAQASPATGWGLHGVGFLVWWLAGGGLLACGYRTCCRYQWDWSYVENYTVDASIFNTQPFLGLGCCGLNAASDPVMGCGCGVFS